MKEKKTVYRKAIIKTGKTYKFGQSLKKGQEVLIEEICIGKGRYTFVAYDPANMTVGMPVTKSQFEYTEKEKYIVMVTRISYCTKEFEVEATDRKEAEILANKEACNTVFGEDDAKYEIEGIFTKKQWNEMGATNPRFFFLFHKTYTVKTKT